MWNAALSTMWAIDRFEDLDQFFLTAGELGFRYVELNHQVTSRMLGSVQLERYCVSSVHEPCPADIPAATLKARNWLVSSPDEHSRQRGVLAAKRSIDLAQRVGARIVIVHAGRVDIDAELEARLWALFDKGQAAGARYAALKEELIAARAKQAPANLDAARRSIAALAEYAARAGVRLGLENRYHYLDIPLPDELQDLLAVAGEQHAGFLYDVGHAQTLENLGFVPHKAWLERFAERMIGVHLHDIKGLRDHYAAGLGEVDWQMVAAHLPPDALRTCEFRSHTSPDQVLDGLAFLIAKGCIKRAKSE